MIALIDSRLIFRILKYYTQKSDSHIFKQLHLDPSSSGRRFKEGLNGKYWWPKHADWYYAMVDGSRQEDDVFYCEDQEFPLAEDKDTLIHIVNLENQKDNQRYGSNALRFPLSKAKYQITFESTLYNALMRVFREQGNNDFPAVQFAIVKLCEQMDIDSQLTYQLECMDDFSTLCRFLVIRGKDAAGSPLLQERKEIAAPDDSRDRPVTLEQLVKQMNQLVHKMEDIQRKIELAIQTNNAVWERIYQRQLDVHISMQELLHAQLRDLLVQHKLCQNSCDDLRRDVMLFVDEHTYAQDEPCEIVVAEDRSWQCVTGEASDHGGEMLLLQQRMALMAGCIDELGEQYNLLVRFLDEIQRKPETDIDIFSEIES